MFKITSVKRINGETHLTIVKEDETAALCVCLFKEAHEFAKAYDHKASAEIGADLFQKGRPEKTALARAGRADQLKSYRELTGARCQRAQILQELRRSQGEDVTLDRIFSELTLAGNEEKGNLSNQVGQLSTSGHSLAFIAKNLGFPNTTVSCYLRAPKLGRQGMRPPVPPRIWSSCVPENARHRKARLIAHKVPLWDANDFALGFV